MEIEEHSVGGLVLGQCLPGGGKKRKEDGKKEYIILATGKAYVSYLLRRQVFN